MSHTEAALSGRDLKRSVAVVARNLSFSCFSSSILPSDICRIRVPYSATACECVTTITSLPSWAICSSSSKTSAVLAESSAPVGSSAIMISGSDANALAMATRCFCPPDNCEGYLLI